MERAGIGPWNFAFNSHQVTMTLSEMEQLHALIKEWECVFVREGNAAERMFEKQSLLIRVDYVLCEDKIGVYEVEERPCGIGMGMVKHPYFKSRFPMLFKQWRGYAGPIHVVISESRQDSCDDAIWADALNLEVFNTPCPQREGCYWVRADPPEKDYHEIIPKSLTNISTEGYKGYGVPLGLWQHIPANLELLPWEHGFALKPAQGSRLLNLHLWNPLGKKHGGLATKTKIIEMITSRKVEYYQDWIEPENPSFLPEGSHLFRRVFFGWNLISHAWECLGGFYTARMKQYRLHGASDAVFGCICSL